MFLSSSACEPQNPDTISVEPQQDGDEEKGDDLTDAEADAAPGEPAPTVQVEDTLTPSYSGYTERRSGVESESVVADGHVIPAPSVEIEVCQVSEDAVEPGPVKDDQPADRGKQATNEPEDVVQAAASKRPPRLTAGFLLPAAYIQWNSILANHCLLGRLEDGGSAYLSITPKVLSAALEQETGELLSAADAAENFVATVADAYRSSIASEPDGVWCLAGLGAEDVPNTIAFLGLSVFAAYQMHSDEEAGPNAYYPRLASLLGCGRVGGYPLGFDPTAFEALWGYTNRWLERQFGKTLALPKTDGAARRFIAYPLCHVPLREIDIEKLPDFFAWAGFEPGSKVSPESLGDRLQQWTSARGLLSQAGQSALHDERRSAVESQLALELDAWDGASMDQLGCRSAPVHVLLDFVRRRACLYFLPRRPAAFPTVFDDGSHIFEAGEQGWYAPVPALVDDGPALRDGFRWTQSSPQGAMALSRLASSVIALRPAPDFTGYLSQQGIPLGIKSAVLCTVERASAVADFLSRVSGTACQPANYPDMPEGWRLFPAVVPRTNIPNPEGLDAIAVETAVSVTFQGGLRVGRRSAWMAGAPPAVLIGGANGVAAAVDGCPVSVEDGRIDASDHLDVGQHVLEVGRVRRRIEIVEPEGRWEDYVSLVGANGRGAVALPPGPWAVIGAKAGQVATGMASSVGGLVAASFPPVWAVSTRAGRGAYVLRIAEHSAPPDVAGLVHPGLRVSPQVRAWVLAIYNAHIRHPRLGWACEENMEINLRAEWRRYWLAARELKRQWRSNR